MQLLSSIPLIIYCFFVSAQKDQNFVHFEKIDNRVEIWVDNEKKYDSGEISGNPELTLQVSLDEWLLPDSKNMTIKLFNGSEDYPDLEDKHWEIRYELFLDKEPVDYVWEYADNNKKGVIFEKEYLLSEWNR